MNDLCTNCASKPKLPSSTKGYCASCSSTAAKAWLERIDNTNAKRQERDNKNQQILEAATEAGRIRGQQLDCPDNNGRFCVLVTPGNCSYIHHLKKLGVTISRNPSGGVLIHPGEDVPATQQFGWADGYAKALRNSFIMAMPKSVL